MFLEIRKGTCENSGTKYYCFVNNQEDEISKLCSNYAPIDFAYFRKIIEQLILSDEGFVQSTDSLTLCNSLPEQKKMTYVHAKALLRGWCSEHWLIEDRGNNSFLLGPRALIELGQYIKTAYGDHVTDCSLCNTICIYGTRCEDCNTKFHFHCKTKLNRNLETLRCPNCKVEWS